MEECLELCTSVQEVIEHKIGFSDTEDTSWPRSYAWMGSLSVHRHCPGQAGGANGLVRQWYSWFWFPVRTTPAISQGE
jgi:hypothetical protein